jgi:hypothetical protein
MTGRGEVMGESLRERIAEALAHDERVGRPTPYPHRIDDITSLLRAARSLLPEALAELERMAKERDAIRRICDHLGNLGAPWLAVNGPFDTIPVDSLVEWSKDRIDMMRSEYVNVAKQLTAAEARAVRSHEILEATESKLTAAEARLKVAREAFERIAKWELHYGHAEARLALAALDAGGKGE